jgi:hypothetical protein
VVAVVVVGEQTGDVVLTTKGRAAGLFSRPAQGGTGVAGETSGGSGCNGSGGQLESGVKKLRRKGASASAGDYELGVEERAPTRVVGRRGGAAPERLALGPSKDAKLDAIKMHASLLADACISRPEHHSMALQRLHWFCGIPNAQPTVAALACLLAFAAQHGCSAPQPTHWTDARWRFAVPAPPAQLTSHLSPLPAPTSEIRQPNEDA